MSEDTCNTLNSKDIQDKEDFPLGEVPDSARKGLWSLSVVLLGFTFFTSTMWAGGSLGISYKFWPDLIFVMLLGNLLLGIYVAILGYIAFKSRLNTVLMCRFCFGDFGSKWPDLVFGLTQIGWYAWGTAMIAFMFTELVGFSDSFSIPLMIFFGFFFCWTAYKGFKGLEILAAVAVPMMLILIIWSFIIATRDVGGFTGLAKIVPIETMTFGTALTIVFGTFVSGGTQATNWSRFANSASIAVWASLFAFFLGNGLMIFAGAYGGYVYQEPDIVRVLAIQGLWLPAIIMLLLNVWTTQGNTIYNFSVAGCNLFRSDKRRYFSIGGAALGTLLAILGMYELLIPFIILLGTVIPPIGGVIMADFFINHKGRYPKLSEVKFKKFNFVGITAYVLAALIANFSPGVAPINGVISAVILYAIINKIFIYSGHPQNHEITQFKM